jgi:segregation and condensation protein A
VRVGELDISGLPVLEVVRQCDEYMRLIEGLDLDVAGDHLVMAATLVHMKSRRLLPPDPTAPSDVEEEEEASRVTIAVQELRRAAEGLQEREAAMELIFTRPQAAIAEFSGEQGIEADLYALVSALQSILKRLGSEPESGRVTRERVSLMDRVTWLVEHLTQHRRVSFRSLFEGVEDRLACILTFLALLEVLRLRLARAFQSHRQQDILVVLAEEFEPQSPKVEEVPPDA